ncbi:YraN family protein [Candidatus Omnitrophota bacterium]
MSKKHIELGAAGEAAALHYLSKHGYVIREKNLKSRLGEIDIIAREKDTLCFIEVKTRSDLQKGYPQEAITPHKQRQIARVALQYVKKNNLFGKKTRFDIVSIIVGDEGTPRIKLIKNAFDVDCSYNY